MLTNEEMHAAFDRVLGCMLKAGWLVNYSYTDGKGWHLGWTDSGSRRATALKEIFLGYGLLDGDLNALMFDKLAHGESLPAGFKLQGTLKPSHARSWRDAIAEVGMRGNDDGLLTLGHIIDGWCPDASTRIKVIPEN